MGNDRYTSADLAIDELKAQVAKARSGSLYGESTAPIRDALERVQEAVKEIEDNYVAEDPAEADDLSRYTWAERAILLEQGRNKVDDKSDVRDSVKDPSSVKTEDEPQSQPKSAKQPKASQDAE